MYTCTYVHLLQVVRLFWRILVVERVQFSLYVRTYDSLSTLRHKDSRVSCAIEVVLSLKHTFTCLSPASSVSGYFVRKFVFDYYAQKEYLKGLAVKNEVTRQELVSYAEKMHEVETRAAEEKRLEAFQEEAKKKHYMLSTETSRGPYFPGHHKWVMLDNAHVHKASPTVHTFECTWHTTLYIRTYMYYITCL